MDLKFAFMAIEIQFAREVINSSLPYNAHHTQLIENNSIALITEKVQMIAWYKKELNTSDAIFPSHKLLDCV